jgi:hypothetical protein
MYDDVCMYIYMWTYVLILSKKLRLRSVFADNRHVYMHMHVGGVTHLEFFPVLTHTRWGDPPPPPRGKGWMIFDLCQTWLMRHIWIHTLLRITIVQDAHFIVYKYMSRFTWWCFFKNTYWLYMRIYTYVYTWMQIYTWYMSRFTWWCFFSYTHIQYIYILCLHCGDGFLVVFFGRVVVWPDIACFSWMICKHVYSSPFCFAFVSAFYRLPAFFAGHLCLRDRAQVQVSSFIFVFFSLISSVCVWL